MQYRTFSIPLDEGGFEPHYKIEDVGLNRKDFHSFSYIDVYGSHSPPIDEVPEQIKLHIDRSFFTQYVPAGDDIEYSYRLELTSLTTIDSDKILKFVSLPGVKEIETTIFHLSHILKRALYADKPIDDILSAIKECK